MTRSARFLLLFYVALHASGCATGSGAVKSALFEQTNGAPLELAATAFYPQTTDQCGPAALATVLGETGLSVHPGELAPRMYIPGRQGSLQIELMAAARQYARIPYVLNPDILDLLGELQAGRPVLVLQNLGTSFAPVWHFSVVIGYLPAEDRFVLRSGDERRHLVSTSRFLRSWRRADSWAVVALAPGELPANPDADRFVRSVADLESVGQLDAAVAGYRIAVQNWPANPLAWLGLGNAYNELGRLDRAQVAYSEVLKIEPRNLIALNNLALVLAGRGQLEAAIESVDAALAYSESNGPLYEAISQTRAEILAIR